MAGTILYKFDLDASKFQTGLKAAGRSLNTTQTNFKRIAGSIAGTLGVAFGTGAVVNFVKDLAVLSGKADGVTRAFSRIADKDYLKSLRDSTHKTIGDLELMTRAIQAKNFDIPLKSLGNLFEFATARAQQTGESVDHLVDSIVLGIGRKSPLILDNLGISAIKLREKLSGVSAASASVGDVAKVVGQIATEELVKMGGVADNTATKIASITAEWQNFKLELSQDEGFKEYLSGSLKELDEVSKISMSNQISGWKKWTTILFSSTEKWEKLAAKIKDLNEESSRMANPFVSLDTQLKDIEAQVEALIKWEDLSKSQITTYSDLKSQISEYTKLLDSADITNSSYIKTIYAEIEALKKKKSAFEALAKPQVVREIAPPKMDTGKGSENLASLFDFQFEMPSGLANMSGFMQGQKEKIQSINDEISESFRLMSDNITNSMFKIGNAIGGAVGSWFTFAGAIFEQLPLLIKNIQALSNAQIAASLGIITAKQSEAMASSAAGAAKLPFPANLIAMIGAVAAAASIFSSIPKPAKMAFGGTVPPGFNNDTYPALLSSGETVIPAPGKLGSSGLLGGLNINISGELKVRNGELVWAVAEGNYKISKTRG